MEITANQILGLAVYSLEQGERIGQVRRFILDTKEKELLALLVANKKIAREESILYLTDAVGLSAEAVTVDSPAVLRKKSECPQLKEMLKAVNTIEGLSVLKKDGTFLGRAFSFYIDSETGKITKIELDNGFWSSFVHHRVFLPIGDIEIIGNDMILAKDSAEIREDQTVSGQKKDALKKKATAFSKTAAGYGEKITALSDKTVFSRHRKVVFPEIDITENNVEDQKEETVPTK